MFKAWNNKSKPVNKASLSHDLDSLENLRWAELCFFSFFHMHIQKRSKPPYMCCLRSKSWLVPPHTHTSNSPRIVLLLWHYIVTQPDMSRAKRGSSSRVLLLALTGVQRYIFSGGCLYEKALLDRGDGQIKPIGNSWDQYPAVLNSRLWRANGRA